MIASRQGLCEVLDFRSWAEDGQPLTMPQINEKKRQVEEAEARVRDILLRLDANGGSGGRARPRQSARSRRCSPTSGATTKFRLAADRIRTQPGLRERFALGVARQRPYLARMERIFGEEGMPPQLARVRAHRVVLRRERVLEVGAAGVWQFMPSTGRQYMMVNDAVDERRIRCARRARRAT